MRVFVDANILISVLCNEYPQFTYCARLLSLSDNPKFEVYTSPICLAIAYYFAEKKNGNDLARKKISLLCSKLRITMVDESAVRKTNSNKAIHDFEDGLQYYSALGSKCKCIVSHDREDFYFSEIEVLGAEDFLLKHVAKVK
jgi:predicted nucleic acid-binding protein